MKWWWLVAFALLPSVASAGSRDSLAQHWAPVYYQETNDPVKDLYTAFDFDDNWNGDDQQENMECWNDSTKCNTADNPNSMCAGQKCPLVATTYYTVIETDTHWFIQYMPYHPLDYKATNGHENDTESILMVVEKDGSQFGKLQFMETRFHIYWYQYSNDPSITDGADNVDGPVHFDSPSGRPAVYVQMVGHGICGGFSPPNRLFPDLQLTCNHNEQPHIDQTGVIYTPDLPAAMPTIVDGTTVKAGYNLVELLTSVWPHIDEIGAGKAFQAAMNYTGERCAMFTCPMNFGGNWEGNEGTSPGEPWAQDPGNGASATGDQFFDPAFTMSKRVTFPMPFSLTYCYNPYLGISDTCADAEPDGGAPLDAGVADLASDDGMHISGGGGSGGPMYGAAKTGCACELGAHSGTPPFTTMILVIGVIVMRSRKPRRIGYSRGFMRLK